MHCNDAPGAIARLDDMGIAPFLISSSVILSCAQRLMRRICSHCKEPVTYPAKMFEDLGIDPSMFDGVQLYRGRGCDRCKNSGYAGRMAIIEAMTITDQIRKLIIARASTREMAKLAINQGMRTLRMVALDRARDGISTLEHALFQGELAFSSGVARDSAPAFCAFINALRCGLKIRFPDSGCWGKWRKGLFASS
jgi:type IV pilus assembly protein PilB